MSTATPATPAAPTAKSRSSMTRVAAASTIGSVIEFYDFIIYGTAAALVFPAVFFPALGTAAGTVAAFATFAVAFVARPLGALIFGHYGDRLGRKKTLIVTLLIMGGATFLTSYGTTVLEHSRPSVLTAGIIAALVFAGGTVLAGILSDRFGRRPVILASLILALPWSLVLFPLLDSGSYGAFVLGLSVTMFIVGGSYGPFGSCLPELFQTRYRYTGAGTAYNLAALLGGGITPLVAAALAATFGGTAIGYLLAGVAVLSLVCAIALRETSGHSLDDAEDGPTDATEEPRTDEPAGVLI